MKEKVSLIGAGMGCNSLVLFEISNLTFSKKNRVDMGPVQLFVNIKFNLVKAGHVNGKGIDNWVW